MSRSIKYLCRSSSDRKIAGVCGGLGDYFNIDPSIMRLIFVLVVLFSVGVGIVAYLVMWIILPLSDESPSSRVVDDKGTKPKE